MIIVKAWITRWFQVISDVSMWPGHQFNDQDVTCEHQHFTLKFSALSPCFIANFNPPESSFEHFPGLEIVRCAHVKDINLILRVDQNKTKGQTCMSLFKLCKLFSDYRKLTPFLNKCLSQLCCLNPFIKFGALRNKQCCSEAINTETLCPICTSVIWTHCHSFCRTLTHLVDTCLNKLVWLFYQKHTFDIHVYCLILFHTINNMSCF